jgi:hypothetical protein
MILQWYILKKVLERWLNARFLLNDVKKITTLRLILVYFVNLCVIVFLIKLLILKVLNPLTKKYIEYKAALWFPKSVKA